MNAFVQLGQRGLQKLSIFQLLQPTNKLEYNLKGFKNKYFKTDYLMENTKCGVEIHKAGLLLKGDFPHRREAISIMMNEIESITLIRGKQTIDTFRMSPIHLLTSLKVSSCFARHFAVDPEEFVVEETKILIKTKDQQLELASCGHRFARIKRSFKAAGYGRKLKIVKGPVYKMVDDQPVLGY